MNEAKKYGGNSGEVEAMILTEDTADDVQEWLVSSGQEVFAPEAGLVMFKHNYDTFAAWDDYVVRGVQGEFYPCKPDVFKASYEAVRDDG